MATTQELIEAMTAKLIEVGDALAGIKTFMDETDARCEVVEQYLGLPVKPRLTSRQQKD